MNRRIPTIEEYINENQKINVLNEARNTDVDNALIKYLSKILKGLSPIKFGPDTYDIIKKFVSNEAKGHGWFSEILQSKSYTKALDRQWGPSSFNGKYTFYIDSNNDIKVITTDRIAGTSVDLEYDNGKWIGWNDIESYMYEKMPEAFKDKWFEVFIYTDPYKGWVMAELLNLCKRQQKKLQKQRQKQQIGLAMAYKKLTKPE